MDQTKIWDYFQNDEEAGNKAFNARPRYEFIAQQIIPGKNVLNIGVGLGGLELILIKKKVLVSSLDPSENAIDKLRNQLALGDRAKVGFSQHIPFPDQQFDVVVMSEVLEHLTDEVLNTTLAEARRVLKPGGKFIGTVPAEENLIDSRVMCPHCGESFHRWGHLQSFNEEHLCALLSQYFDDVALSRHVFSEVRTLNWKGRFGLNLKKLMMKLGIKGSGETFFFSAVNR